MSKHKSRQQKNGSGSTSLAEMFYIFFVFSLLDQPKLILERFREKRPGVRVVLNGSYTRYLLRTLRWNKDNEVLIKEEYAIKGLLLSLRGWQLSRGSDKDAA